jgi:hypothetical protein
MYVYTLRNGQHIPRSLVVVVASWTISLLAVTVIGIAIWLAHSVGHFDALRSLPKPLLVLLGLLGAYAGVGSICLWVYWIAVERSSVAVRIGWCLVLLLGLHYGALVYLYRVWPTRASTTGGTVVCPNPIS